MHRNLNNAPIPSDVPLPAPSDAVVNQSRFVRPMNDPVLSDYNPNFLPNLAQRDWALMFLPRSEPCPTFDNCQNCPHGNSCTEAHVHRPRRPLSHALPSESMLYLAYTEIRRVPLRSTDFRVASRRDASGKLWHAAAFFCPIDRIVYHAAGGPYGRPNGRGVHWYATVKHAMDALAATVVAALVDRGVLSSPQPFFGRGENAPRLFVPQNQMTMQLANGPRDAPRAALDDEPSQRPQEPRRLDGDETSDTATATSEDEQLAEEALLAMKGARRDFVSEKNFPPAPQVVEAPVPDRNQAVVAPDCQSDKVMTEAVDPSIRTANQQRPSTAGAKPQDKKKAHKATGPPPSSVTKTGRRKWKKPKGKPKRPLSAYNLFFQHERNRILDRIPSAAAAVDAKPPSGQRRRHRKSHGKIGFADLARGIAEKWKTLDAESKRDFEAMAAVEKGRYRDALAVWNAHRQSGEEDREGDECGGEMGEADRDDVTAGSFEDAAATTNTAPQGLTRVRLRVESLKPEPSFHEATRAAPFLANAAQKWPLAPPDTLRGPAENRLSNQARLLLNLGPHDGNRMHAVHPSQIPSWKQGKELPKSLQAFGGPPQTQYYKPSPAAQDPPERSANLEAEIRSWVSSRSS